jgi:hypothetical protein
MARSPTLYLPVMIVAALMVASAVALLAVSQKAEATFPDKNGRIAYSAFDFDGGVDETISTIKAGGASLGLQLEQLPGYAADLNPDEGFWKHLKCVEPKNLCCQSLAQLRVELGKAKERLRHKKHVILGCIRQPGFEL